MGCIIKWKEFKSPLLSMPLHHFLSVSLSLNVLQFMNTTVLNLKSRLDRDEDRINVTTPTENVLIFKRERL